MKTVLNLPSGASVNVSVSDLEALFPSRIVPVPAVDGGPLAIGQSIALVAGVTLTVAADDPIPEPAVVVEP